jgi:hypothetical protein
MEDLAEIEPGFGLIGVVVGREILGLAQGGAVTLHFS